MAGTKVNNYAIGDSNIESVMLTTDQIYKGQCQVTLTEMSTTTVPKIAAGSWIENNGTLFKFDSDETLTGSPLNGIVYIRIVPSTTTCTAEMTNTAPTWSDSKQGWYGTGGAANYRYIGGIWIKYGSGYFGKFTYQNRLLYRPAFTYTETITDEFTMTWGGGIIDVTPAFNSIKVYISEIVIISISADAKLVPSGSASIYGEIYGISDDIISSTYATYSEPGLTSHLLDTDNDGLYYPSCRAGIHSTTDPSRTFYIKNRVLTINFFSLVI